MPQRELPVPDNDDDRKLLADIARHGWVVLAIKEDDEGPAFAYSVGLFHTFDHPEILIIGLPPKTAHPLINDLGETIRGGRRFEVGSRCDDVASTTLVFNGMDERHYREYLGYARWFYHGSDFPTLQCVWPDKQGIFPWEEGFDSRFFQVQRILGPAGALTEGWLFPDPPNLATFTMRKVVRAGQPILSVVHDEDGSWQFLTSGRCKAVDGLIVCLADMVRRDPSLIELANLPAGWRAWRASVGDPWNREPK
jgi:hypothetical protein